VHITMVASGTSRYRGPVTASGYVAIVVGVSLATVVRGLRSHRTSRTARPRPAAEPTTLPLAEWQRIRSAYIAADRAEQSSLAALLATDYTPVLRHALQGGQPEAVDLIIRIRPAAFLDTNLDVLLPLLLDEDESEDTELRDLVCGLDRAVLDAHLPAFISRTLAHPDEYELPAVMELLVAAQRYDLLAPVVTVASDADYPPARHAAAMYASFTTSRQPALPPPTQIPPAPPPTGPIEQLWSRYVTTVQEQHRAWWQLTRSDEPAAIARWTRSGPGLAALGRALSRRLPWYSELPAIDLALLLNSLHPPRRTALLNALDEALFEDHRNAVERFRTYTDLLGLLNETQRLTAALRNGQTAPDQHVRMLAELIDQL
jgi:hypothetical protein